MFSTSLQMVLSDAFGVDLFSNSIISFSFFSYMADEEKLSY